LQDLDERRDQLLRHIDRGGFQELVVITAGLGFFAGAYQVFAVSLTLPLIRLVYSERFLTSDPDKNDSLDVGLRSSILAGAIIGMVVFGFLADIYGRRKLYGWELALLLLAGAGVAMSSTGSNDSMDIFGWLVSWRLIMGIGMQRQDLGLIRLT
jgi:MFS transporter, PHS family, inorganic phosphate transporter